MSRNRAFRLLKDARLRASATSVGGTSSRVGQTVTRSADLARCAYTFSIFIQFYANLHRANHYPMDDPGLFETGLR